MCAYKCGVERAGCDGIKHSSFLPLAFRIIIDLYTYRIDFVGLPLPSLSPVSTFPSLMSRRKSSIRRRGQVSLPSLHVRGLLFDFDSLPIMFVLTTAPSYLLLYREPRMMMSKTTIDKMGKGGSSSKLFPWERSIGGK